MKEIGTVEIDLDQFEAMRLCDVDGLDQAEAGGILGVSRGTVQRLLYEGRRRLMGAILDNSAVVVNLKNSEVDDVDMCANKQRRRSRRRHS